MCKYKSDSTGYVYDSLEELMNDYNNVTNNNSEPYAWNSDWGLDKESASIEEILEDFEEIDD